MGRDHCDHTVQVSKDITRSDPQEFEPSRFQVGLPQPIDHHNFVVPMDVTVHFDDQPF
jgi:hypothetical protein